MAIAYLSMFCLGVVWMIDVSFEPPMRTYSLVGLGVVWSLFGIVYFYHLFKDQKKRRF